MALGALPETRSISHMFSSDGLSIPANRVPTAVIRVESKMAPAIMAAPIKMGIELPARSDVIAR